MLTGAEASWQDGGGLARLNRAWSQHINDLARASRALTPPQGQSEQSLRSASGTGSRLLDALIPPQDEGGEQKRGQQALSSDPGLTAEAQGQGLGRHRIPAKYILTLVKILLFYHFMPFTVKL